MYTFIPSIWLVENTDQDENTAVLSQQMVKAARSKYLQTNWQ